MSDKHSVIGSFRTHVEAEAVVADREVREPIAV